MSEYEYYTNLPYVNYCKLKGYEEKREREELVIGVASYNLHRSLVQKPETFNKYWPFSSDKEQKKDTKLVWDRGMWLAFKAKHKLK